MLFKILLVFFSLMDSTIAWGYNLGLSDGSFLSVDESYAEFRKYESYRNTMTPGKDDWEWTTEWHNTVSIYKRVFWDSNFHMSMDSSQIRYAGLEYYLGVKIMPYLQAIKYHHSAHCLDTNCGRFPVEDSYGFRVYFKH